MKTIKELEARKEDLRITDKKGYRNLIKESAIKIQALKDVIELIDEFIKSEEVDDDKHTPTVIDRLKQVQTAILGYNQKDYEEGKAQAEYVKELKKRL